MAFFFVFLEKNVPEPRNEKCDNDLPSFSRLMDLCQDPECGRRDSDNGGFDRKPPRHDNNRLDNFRKIFFEKNGPKISLYTGFLNSQPPISAGDPFNGGIISD